MKLPLNEQQWFQLDSLQRNQIEDILNQSFLENGPVEIVPLPDGHRLDSIQPDSMSLGPKGVAICQMVCDVAEASAVAACSLLTDRVAMAACVAAARAAGKICKMGCERLAPPPGSAHPAQEGN